MKYIIKIFRHKPEKSFYLADKSLCRFCTFEKDEAQRYDAYEGALVEIAKYAAGENEHPMIVEVKE